MTARSLFFVIVQLLLFLVFIALPAGYAAKFGWQLTAFIIVIIGIVVVAVAMIQLGPGLTPMPVPKSTGRLVTSGVYRFVRHPLYSGLLLILAGITLYSMNIPRAIVTGLLFFLFHFKSKYEEQLLLQRYPDYENYQKRTWRFLPKIKWKSVSEN